MPPPELDRRWRRRSRIEKGIKLRVVLLVLPTPTRTKHNSTSHSETHRTNTQLNASITAAHEEKKRSLAQQKKWTKLKKIFKNPKNQLPSLNNHQQRFRTN